MTILLGIRADRTRNSVKRFLERLGHEIIAVATVKDVENLAKCAHIIVTEFPVENAIPLTGKKALLQAINNPWNRKSRAEGL
jgi:ornithine cyclodeaminase/alanine dehydrogenase-like protein (mu-crystallin family)